jgi:hypothetical protein
VLPGRIAALVLGCLVLLGGVAGCSGTGQQKASPTSVAKAGCMTADLNRPGPRHLPGKHLTAHVAFHPPEDRNNRRLDPPRPETPAISASAAWKDFQHLGQLRGGGEWQLVLALYSAATPGDLLADGSVKPRDVNVPVWVLVGRHVAVSSVYHGPEPPSTLAPPPACSFETVVTMIDARTGQSFGGEMFNDRPNWIIPTT